MAVLSAATASAQVTPAAGSTPPDDTQVIRLGLTVFGNYMYQTDPKGTNADGTEFHYNAFDLARSYINVTGNISHIVAYRVTPDIFREVACPAATCTSNGSLVFRIKYGYVQTNFDDWMTRGSYAKFGIHQTPYLDYTETIYRYRFQGTTFVERVGKQSSADAGASFHYNFNNNYGDVHVGVYNGENYNKTEINSSDKAFKIRASARPFATQQAILRGLRATVYADMDNVTKDAERRRTVFEVTYEHPKVVAGFEQLWATDQTSATATKIDSGGYSIWATPRMGPTSTGWEGLIRFDHFVPDKRSDINAAAPGVGTRFEDQKQDRFIIGLAYWFPHPAGGATTALMLDYDGQTFSNINPGAPSTSTSIVLPTGTPAKAIAIHLLINY